jgi:ParB family chromosome partitioning protein
MKRKVLGKGIESIITNKPVTGKDGNLAEIDIDEIYPNPFQPRKSFDMEKTRELANSIKEAGMIQPVVLFRENEKYYLIVGERRWRAAQFLNWKKVPAIIKEMPRGEALIGALVENIQREDLNAIEVAEGINMLMKQEGLNQDETGDKLGMNRSTVANYLRLLKLPDVIKQGVVAGEISPGHARALLAFENVSDMIENYSKVVKNKLSVRQTEQLISKVNKKSIKSAPRIDPNIRWIEEKLTRLLSTKVKINYSKSGNGKIEIFFSQLNEFERIYKLFLKE